MISCTSHRACNGRAATTTEARPQAYSCRPPNVIVQCRGQAGAFFCCLTSDPTPFSPPYILDPGCIRMRRMQPGAPERSHQTLPLSLEMQHGLVRQPRANGPVPVVGRKVIAAAGEEQQPATVALDNLVIAHVFRTQADTVL